MKPKPFSIQHRSVLLQASTFTLALCFIVSALYIGLKIQQGLQDPLQNLHATLPLDFQIDATLKELMAVAEQTHLRRPGFPPPEFQVASRRLRELTGLYLSSQLTGKERRQIENIEHLQGRLIARVDQLFSAKGGTAEVEAQIREAHDLGDQIELDLHHVTQNQFARLETSSAKLRHYTRVLYLLLTAFALFAVFSLRLFGRAQHQHVWAPLEGLRRMALEIQRGNLEIQAKVPASVEIGPLVQAFLNMATEVREARNWLEQKVLERTAKLETAQKQLLQAAKLSSLGQLVSGVAHEFNNPLTSILGFSEVLLAQPGLGPRLAAHVQTIRNESLRLKNLVVNLSNFARQGVHRVSCLDLRQVLDRLVDLRRYQLAANNVQLHYARPAEPVWVEGDADQLLQVFFNLVLNSEQAIQACREKGEIGLACGVEAGKAWATVRDNGTGMSPTVMERIFDPFFTTKLVGQGTGLGLSMSHGILQQHRGEISVESVEGQGTTIRVSLPAAQPAGETPLAPGETPKETGNGTAPRALVIDDEPAITELVEHALESQGWSSTVVSDPAQVEAALAEADFDLVICDLKMPGKSGLEILRLLRQKRPKLAQRFLLMTGNLADGEREDVELASVPVLRKPFPLARLAEAVSLLMQKED